MIIDWINPLNTSWSVWGLTAFCAFLVGLSKSGLKGTAMIAIPLLAYGYGGKASVGVLLPFLIMGDIMALAFYHKSGKMKHIIRLFPWAIGGILLAVVVGNQISDQQFTNIIAIAILVCWVLIVWNDRRKGKKDLSHHPVFRSSLGISGGFATMMGNAAGPIFNLYLLSMRLPKESYIGTGAWFYVILNVFKVPFHVVSWHTISWRTIQLNIVLFPILMIGAFLGRYLVRFIPEREYRIFIFAVILISAIMLLFK